MGGCTWLTVVVIQIAQKISLVEKNFELRTYLVEIFLAWIRIRIRIEKKSWIRIRIKRIRIHITAQHCTKSFEF